MCKYKGNLINMQVIKDKSSVEHINLLNFKKKRDIAFTLYPPQTLFNNLNKFRWNTYTFTF